jgi:hypothetical protein
VQRNIKEGLKGFGGEGGRVCGVFHTKQTLVFACARRQRQGPAPEAKCGGNLGVVLGRKLRGVVLGRNKREKESFLPCLFVFIFFNPVCTGLKVVESISHI